MEVIEVWHAGDDRLEERGCHGAFENERARSGVREATKEGNDGGRRFSDVVDDARERFEGGECAVAIEKVLETPRVVVVDDESFKVRGPAEAGLSLRLTVVKSVDL